jgi:translation initiation factor IF-2
LSPQVAGCRVLTGYIKVGCNIRILRGNIIMYEGKLQSLRSFKDLVDQVTRSPTPPIHTSHSHLICTLCTG